MNHAPASRSALPSHPTSTRTPVDSVRRRLAPLAALALLAVWSGPVYAIDIVAIEEHWELSVGEPDAESSSPQVCMVMSPTGDLDSDYFIFTLNHRSHPEWAPGGMQVQQWCGETLVDSRESSADETLTQGDELITWVQRTEVHGENLTFEVKDGHSSSWGDFGVGDHLKLNINCHAHSLNDYRPAISLGESGVSYAGNRVRSLILRKLRWWDAAGNVYELNAPIDIGADLDP